MPDCGRRAGIPAKHAAARLRPSQIRLDASVLQGPQPRAAGALALPRTECGCCDECAWVPRVSCMLMCFYNLPPSLEREGVTVRTTDLLTLASDCFFDWFDHWKSSGLARTQSRLDKYASDVRDFPTAQ